MTDQTRINVRLPADLWRHVKAQAALDGKTATDVVIEALRAWLERRQREAQP
jgi:uncharacterized protein (DUF1778 family)